MLELYLVQVKSSGITSMPGRTRPELRASQTARAEEAGILESQLPCCDCADGSRLADCFSVAKLQDEIPRQQDGGTSLSRTRLLSVCILRWTARK